MAESLYEVAVLAIKPFRQHDCEPGMACRLTCQSRTSRSLAGAPHTGRRRNRIDLATTGGVQQFLSCFRSAAPELTSFEREAHEGLLFSRERFPYIARYGVHIAAGVSIPVPYVPIVRSGGRFSAVRRAPVQRPRVESFRRKIQVS
jgi:hypothetical protein